MRLRRRSGQGHHVALTPILLGPFEVYDVPSNDRRYAIGIVYATLNPVFYPVFEGSENMPWTTPLATSVPVIYHARDWGDLTTFAWRLRHIALGTIGVLLYEAFLL